MTRPAEGRTTWRLVDGSELADWHPGPGDAPCDAHGPGAYVGHSRDGCPDLHRYEETVDALNDPAHVVPPPPPPPGRHRADVDVLHLSAVRLAAGETCLDCESTALVGHWHTATDCLVARTGWGGP